MSRKARNWLLMGLVLGIIVLLRATTSRPLPPTGYFDVPRPMVIAHRGGAGLRPENTLLAFEHAVGLGADVLEMDVRLTADGVPVVIHDPNVERTTDGQGAVADMVHAQLRNLDAGYHWPFDGTAPYRGQGVHIPELAEVLARFPQQPVNLELKDDDESAARQVCDVLGTHDAADRVLVASFHADVVAAFRRACPAVATSATDAEVTWFYIYQWLGIEGLYQPAAHALQVPPTARGVTLAQAPLFAAAQARGLHVDVWTVNDRAAMRRLFAEGATGIITDRPDIALDVLGRGSRY